MKIMIIQQKLYYNHHTPNVCDITYDDDIT